MVPKLLYALVLLASLFVAASSHHMDADATPEKTRQGADPFFSKLASSRTVGGGGSGAQGGTGKSRWLEGLSLL